MGAGKFPAPRLVFAINFLILLDIADLRLPVSTENSL
jgi:hypothetical protein